MNLFVGSTANEAWLCAASALRGDEAVPIEGRGGRARELLHAAFEVRNPRERWVHGREPAMNPAFAIAEFVWIIAGRDDSAFVDFWNPALPRFAGNVDVYHGAYGARLRRRFGFDQLARAAEALASNAATRQVVLQIWDPTSDMPHADGEPAALDIPCNVSSLLKVRSGKLEWLQVIRSNDIFLGVPHNFVQFMTLQEVLAGWIGVDVGTYVQVSDSLHVYERDRVALAASDDTTPAVNTDRFVEPRTNSLAYFRALATAMDEMRLADCSAVRCVELALQLDAPAAYLNCAFVVAADAARRHGGEDEAQRVMDECSNPMLRRLWSRWLERCSRRRSLATAIS